MECLVESALDLRDAARRCIIPAGEPWIHELRRGEILRIVDLQGHQTADTLFYNAHNTSDRYSAQDTIRRQRNIYLTTGTRLISTANNALLTIVADTCGRHDTLGGACTSESNMVRFSLDKRHHHACRHSFIKALMERGQGMGKRDITSNISFFRNVPVTPRGDLSFSDGLPKAGRYVEMKAEMDVLALISNCPQVNLPWSEHHPAPIEVLIWGADHRG
jgi:urea carboxylase-associated protein 1